MAVHRLVQSANVSASLCGEEGIVWSLKMEDLYIFLAAVISIVVVRKLILAKKHNYPPGPRPLPVIGNLNAMKPPLHVYFERVAKKLGPVLLLWMGKVPLLVVSSPEAFEDVYSKNDIVFADRPPSMAVELLTYNNTNMVWAPYDTVWKSLRRLTNNEVFSPKALQKSSYILESEVRHIVGRLYRMAAGGNKTKVDMKHMFSLLTASTFVRVVAGKRHVPIVDEDTKEEKRLLDQFKDAFYPVVSMNICDFIPMTRWVLYKGIKQNMMKLFKKRDDFLNNLMSDIQAKRDAGSLGEDDERSVINKILTLQEGDPEFYTDSIVKGIIMILFIGGTETSTSTLEWALTLLLQHPEKMKKLQAEIDLVVGEERLLIDADVAQLPYLRAVVKEAMRLYPPTPLLLPHFSKEETTIQGYEIPKGTTVLGNVWAMHRDPRHWENPNDFVPERFLNADPDAYTYAPFGIGRRSCPGAAMGTNIVNLGLGLIFQCFNWDEISMNEDMSHSIASSVLWKKVPLIATFVPRSQMVELIAEI